MEFVIYVLTIFICFFLLYIFSKQDFVLLRQNISLAQIFDALAVTSIASFLFGRVFYVVNNFKTDLLSILRFFHILKYPGISFFGVVTGGGLCLYLIFAKRKGIARICDIASISFFPLFAVYLLFERYAHIFLLPYAFFLIAIFFFIFFIKSHRKYILHDGSISFIFLLLIVAETFFAEFMSTTQNSVLLSFSILQIIAIIAVPVLFGAIAVNERKKRK